MRWQRPIERHKWLTGRKMNHRNWTPGGSAKPRLADGFANAMDHRQAPKRVRVPTGPLSPVGALPNRDISRLGAPTPLAAATRIRAGGIRHRMPAAPRVRGVVGIRWQSLPLRNPYGVLVRATVQNPKRAGTKIFFIGFRTRTYGDFRGWRSPFFRQNSCNTAGNRGTHMNRRSLKCEV